MGLTNLPSGLEFPSDVDELKQILLEVEPRLQPIPLIRCHVSRFVDGADMDQVYPRLWLGDCDAAMNKTYLLNHKITHVLNAAANRTGPAPVKTGADFYKNTPIIYEGLDLIDLPFANVSRFFEKGASFIKEGLDSGGVVLVHCRQGRSRSASILAAFLMIHRNFTAGKALKLLREHREIRPNNGFLQQLANLDLQLFRQRFEEFRNQPSSDSESDSDSDSDSDSSQDETEDYDHDYESDSDDSLERDISDTGTHVRKSSLSSDSESESESEDSDSECESECEDSDSESESSNESDFSY